MGLLPFLPRDEHYWVLLGESAGARVLIVRVSAVSAPGLLPEQLLVPRVIQTYNLPLRPVPGAFDPAAINSR